MSLEKRFERQENRPLVINDQDAMVLGFHFKLALFLLPMSNWFQLSKRRERNGVSQSFSFTRLKRVP
jgi:hypothetical protein